MRTLPRRVADCRKRRSSERVGPVWLLATVDSVVLEICWLAVGTHAHRVRTITGVMRRAVGNHISTVATDGLEAVVLIVVLESCCAPQRGRAM